MKCSNKLCKYNDDHYRDNFRNTIHAELAIQCMKNGFNHYEPADLPEAGASAEHISSVMHSNAVEVENLKCCGNCLHRSTIDMGSYSDETCDKDNNLSSWQYCEKWEFDGIERSGRTEGFNV